MTPVLATVVMDPFTTLVFGCALALFSTKLIRRSPDVELRTTAIWAVGWSVWYGICVGYMYFVHPDWMLVYLTDARNVPLVPTFLLFLAVMMVTGLCGALACGVLMQQQQTALGWAVGVGAGAANLAAIALQFDAYTHLGTFAQYHAGLAPLMAQTPGGTEMTLIGVASAVPAFAMIGYRFWRGFKT